MGFTEEAFLFVFLPISLLITLATNRIEKMWVRNAVCVILSLAFYAWASLDTLALMCIVVICVYFMGRIAAVFRDVDEKTGRHWVRFLALVCVVFLAYCKYVPAVIEALSQVTGAAISFRAVAATIGVSFTTFEAVSYLVDIYRGDATPGSLLDSACFLLLFPKLVSGPIVLWKDFQPQLKERSAGADQVAAGIDRIIVGYAKKAIIADTLGAQISLIASASGMDAPTMWLKALLYFFQIYYDFSGYSDIAIGICKVMGFRLKENFCFPYTSTSVTEFWRKWHISLGTWFREYVYIPWGGNRTGNVYLHLIGVFLLTGIWHGASWTFVLWGVAHGVAVVFERYLRNKSWYTKIPALVKWALTVAFVYFAWILFMSEDIASALNCYRLMFAGAGDQLLNFTWRYYLTRKIVIMLGIAGIGAVAGAVRLPEKVRMWGSTGWRTGVYRVLLLVLLVIDMMFVVNSTYSPFIYFQF